MNANNATEPGPNGSDAQLTEEQAREYLQKLRATPVDRVVTEVLFGVLNAAQSKLGRRDGRLLIDLSAVMLEHVRQYVPGELSTQVDQILGQLRLGQVQAEKDLAAAGKTEPDDLTQAPSPPTATSAAPPPPQQPTSKLWIPGRD